MSQSHLHTIIEPANQRQFINFKELIRYKDLLYYMVLRDVTVLYKQSVLGFLWAILNPLFQIVVFSLIFGKVAGISTGNPNLPYPVFSCLAVIPWTYFSSTFTASSNSLITTSAIFTKVYFPRMIIPMVPIFSKLVDFFISLIILLGVMLFYQYVPGENVWLFPIPLFIIIITSTGLGFWLSSLALQYRDFRFAIGFILPLLMYVAPVAYPAAKVQQQLGDTAYQLYALYPMVGGIEGFRSSFLQSQPFPWTLVATSGAVAIFLFITGALYFKKMEKHFADVA
jgi:lipopolysaccharide transport system permease protein